MKGGDKINQDQFYSLITGGELSWQTIICDLIKTEQLDPWDIDLFVLSNKYLEIIEKLEEANFYVSSKVLFACSLLLRLKSEILINSYIQSLDDALYGRDDKKKYELERIELDEDDLPVLSPRTPMSRNRKVTLEELMSALNKAINTENRRIKREITSKQTEKAIKMVLPRIDLVPLKVRTKKIFEILKIYLGNGNSHHMKFSSLVSTREERLASFVPLLHLSNNGKLYLRQVRHFEEIYMSFEMHKDELKELENELGFADADEKSLNEDILKDDLVVEEE